MVFDSTEHTDQQIFTLTFLLYLSPKSGTGGPHDMGARDAGIQKSSLQQTPYYVYTNTLL